jgi:hypothetical protein
VLRHYGSGRARWGIKPKMECERVEHTEQCLPPTDRAKTLSFGSETLSRIGCLTLLGRVMFHGKTVSVRP